MALTREHDATVSAKPPDENSLLESGRFDIYCTSLLSTQVSADHAQTESKHPLETPMVRDYKYSKSSRVG